METEMEGRLDMVVFGASGFTGKYVVRELLRQGLGGRSVALAGRSRSKVAEALRWAMEEEASPSPWPSPASLQPPAISIMEADVSDPASLAAMCRRTKLVLDCVGPFRLYGEPVVAACLEAGADYLDICGEPEFMERMEASYHEAAMAKGVLLVSACGYDSIPAEIGLLHHLRHWPPPPPSSSISSSSSSSAAVPNSVDCFLHLTSTERIVGNWGTWESAVLSISSAHELRKLRQSAKKKKKQQQQQSNGGRISVAGPPARKPALLSWNRDLSMWAMLLPSADAAVVRRTMSTIAATTGAPPPSISEEEDRGLSAMDPARRAAVFKPVHFGVFSALPTLFFHVLPQLWLGLSVLSLSAFALGRSLLLRFPRFFSLGLFRRGGPTEKQVDAARFKLWFIGKGFSDPDAAAAAASASSSPRPDARVITSVSGPEIGYVTTPICLVQCALVLLDRRRDLPRGGVYTPGVVFGTTDLQQRLQENGLSFTLESQHGNLP